MTPRVWEANKPGSWRHPTGVIAVHDVQGNRWWRDTTRWTKDGKNWIRWYTLVNEHGPVTEAE